MKIVLAYPRDGHQPDETVDYPSEEARLLVQDGLARWPEHTDAATGERVAAPTPTRDEVRAYASEHGVTQKAAREALVAAAGAPSLTTTLPSAPADAS